MLCPAPGGDVTRGTMLWPVAAGATAGKATGWSASGPVVGSETGGAHYGRMGTGSSGENRKFLAAVPPKRSCLPQALLTQHPASTPGKTQFQLLTSDWKFVPLGVPRGLAHENPGCGTQFFRWDGPQMGFRAFALRSQVSLFVNPGSLLFERGSAPMVLRRG